MRRPRVLIVEDDEELRRLYRHALRLTRYHVEEARGGFEALRLLAAQTPDVVVLDLMMPGLDGFVVLAELAAQTRIPPIPVVIVTASAENLESFTVSCVLRKPVSTEELVEAVEASVGCH